MFDLKRGIAACYNGSRSFWILGRCEEWEIGASRVGTQEKFGVIRNLKCLVECCPERMVGGRNPDDTGFRRPLIGMERTAIPSRRPNELYPRHRRELDLSEHTARVIMMFVGHKRSFRIDIIETVGRAEHHTHPILKRKKIVLNFRMIDGGFLFER